MVHGNHTKIIARLKLLCHLASQQDLLIKDRGENQMKIAKQTRRKLRSFLAEISTSSCTTIRKSSMLSSLAVTQSRTYQSLHHDIQSSISQLLSRHTSFRNSSRMKYRCFNTAKHKQESLPKSNLKMLSRHMTPLTHGRQQKDQANTFTTPFTWSLTHIET